MDPQLRRCITSFRVPFFLCLWQTCEGVFVRESEMKTNSNWHDDDDCRAKEAHIHSRKFPPPPLMSKEKYNLAYQTIGLWSAGKTNSPTLREKEGQEA